MRDSVPSARYSSVCNVLRQWNILLIPTYRVYRLYDIYNFIFKGNVSMIIINIFVYTAQCPTWPLLLFNILILVSTIISCNIISSQLTIKNLSFYQNPLKILISIAIEIATV